MPLIQLTGISKRFPGVQALDDVTVAIEPGTVHALVGENGAGKSTLGKILAGIYQPDDGQIELEGQQVHFPGPLDAVKRGISMVHQELLFCENMTVAENLCLDDLPTKGPFLDEKAMIERATAWLSAIGANIDPRQCLGELPVSRQQLVQIAGGIGRGAKILIFDEPTSSLSHAEAERLLQLIRELKASGVTCIYVSHRLEEIFAVCDTVTVLRDGKHVATKPIGELDQNKLVSLMIGRELSLENTTPDPKPDAPEVLAVQNLNSPGKCADIAFQLREGEIVGLAGLVGAGRTEVAEAIFGLDPAATGTLRFEGKESPIRKPEKAVRMGIGLVPEDRKRHGLVLGMNARHNMSLAILDRLATGGWVREGDEKVMAKTFFDRLRIRAPHIDADTLGLSGGNQQKVVIAKWLAAECKVLLVDEPTRGVDVGAKAEIYALLRDLAAQGKAVLCISSELPELLALSTRILVLRGGRIVAEVARAEATEEVLMRHMAGV